MGNPVIMNLEQENGNAFHLLGAFAAKARTSGWSEGEIAAVRAEAMSGDYDQLLRTLSDHVVHPGESEDGSEND